MPVLARGLALALTLALACGCATLPPAYPRGPAAPAAQLGIWCEFLPYGDVAATLPDLARHNCELILHIEKEDIGDPALAALCRAAEREGVPILAWLLLPYDEHLYLGEYSIEPMRELALRFLDWSAQERLAVKGIALDCEPSPLLGRQMLAELRRFSICGLARLMRTERDPARFAASITRTRAFVDELKARDLVVMGSANRAFLDALHYRNVALQDSLNVSFTMIDWDLATFITYRYLATRGGYLAMVKRYAYLAHAHFGDRAALDLGLTDSHREIPGHRERAELFGAPAYYQRLLDGIRDPQQLAEAIGVALGEGVSRIHLFSLDAAVRSAHGLDEWLASAAAARPRTGPAAWTPVNSLKTAALAATVEGLYRALVGRTPPPRSDSAAACPPLPCAPAPG